MRLLLTTDAVGGVWTYSLTLARALRPHGVRTILAVLGPGPTDAQRREAQCVGDLEWHHHDGRLEWMPDADADVEASGRWLLDLADRAGADLVHVNGYAHGPLPFNRPVVIVAHSCVRSWWRAVKHDAPPPAYDRYCIRVARGLAEVSAVVAPTHAMGEALRHEYGLARPVTVVPNASDAYVQAAAKAPFVFAAGRMDDEAKNLCLLRRAAPLVGWPVVVAGAGTSQRSDAASNLIGLGPLAHRTVLSWMGHAGIYAFPARYEPFGLSILEAARHGCALVLGRIPSLLELWSGAARFVDPDDVSELASALDDLARDPEVRSALGLLAQERAHRFETPAWAAAYLSLYRRLLSTGSDGAMTRRVACAS